MSELNRFVLNEEVLLNSVKKWVSKEVANVLRSLNRSKWKEFLVLLSSGDTFRVGSRKSLELLEKLEARENLNAMVNRFESLT